MYRIVTVSSFSMSGLNPDDADGTVSIRQLIAIQIFFVMSIRGLSNLGNEIVSSGKI